MPITPDMLHPLPGETRMVLLKNVVKSPAISVGEYTYYHDPEGPEHFETRNVLYHYPFNGDRLTIGKFCAIAARATFLMNGANHRKDFFSTYPFPVFWPEQQQCEVRELWQNRGDTVVGHDVWIGYDAAIMPGVTIGHGAIVGTRAVVTRDVPPYGVVVGNPGRVVKVRFDEATVAELLEIAWWDWPIERIVRNLRAICGGELGALRGAR